jgi:PAS domain S-box-containing protein
MFQSNPIPGTLVRLADGIFLDANESFFRMSGYTPAEVIGHTALELNMYPDPSRRTYVMEQLHQHGHLHGHEQLFQTKSGQIRTHQLWFEMITVNGEQCMLVLGVDITEKKQIEGQLQMLKVTVDRHIDGAYWMDSENKLIYVNDAACKTLGYAREELLGKSLKEIAPDATEAHLKQVWERLRKDGSYFNESVHRRKGGNEFPVEIAATYVRFEGREYNCGFARDITERKLLEKSLTRLATAVEQAAETIVITDTDGAIVYANPAFEKSSGYTRAEAFGQNPRVLKSGKQDANFYARMWETLRHGEIWRGHFANKRKDGTLYEEEATITPVRDATGKVVNYVAVKRDVTREVELESQIRQTQKMEAIGQLAGGLAHDFNNILAVIQLQAGLLKNDRTLAGPQLEHARDIERAASCAAELTRQLLLFSRKQAMQLRDHDLNEVVTGITKMLQRVLGENIQISLTLATQPLTIRADSGMIDQVLMNLSVNARDAMPAGGHLFIETATVELDETQTAGQSAARPGSFVRLSVRDTGCGMSPEILTRIYEPFFTTKEQGKGTGLGLATVFGIVQQHQGWITVTSQVGQGATFQIYLPYHQPAVKKNSNWSSFADILHGHETILLAEDDATVRASTSAALTQLGYRVLTAATGAEALALWKRHPGEIKLLLTDLLMPGGINGKELAQRLLPDNPGLKLIYISGYSAELASGDFQLNEGINFLAKPFSIQKLAQIIRHVLEKN